MNQAAVGIAGLLSGSQVSASNTALICNEGPFSYTQLASRVESVCVRLSALGVRPGMTIGCSEAGAVLNLLLLHALPRLGCSFLPLAPSLPETSLRRFIGLGSADVLVTEAPVAGSIRCISPGLLLDIDAHAQLAGVATAPLPAEAPHWMVCTSGTRGEGKLVVLTGDQLLSSVLASRERLAFKASDSWLMCLPLYHVGGLMIPLRCAEAGATLVLHEDYDPLRLWRDLHRHDVTHVSLVPTMLAHLLDLYAGKPPPPNLRVMLVGGGHLPANLARRALAAGWPLCPSYGLTEAASQVATLYPPSSLYVEGLAGRPLSHLQVKIEPGSGRIMIRGDSVMQGYVGEPARRDGWFVTSDLGRLDEHGNLFVLGRADDMLISGGVNVHPRQVEQLLLECSGIREVAVTAVADNLWGDRLVALYVGDLPSHALRAWSREQLPGYMRPQDFVRVEMLPRTALGKLRRNALPGLYTSARNG